MSIQVDQLTIAYQGRTLFKEASFSIQPGEKCGLVGRNGSGKSTLFKLLEGEEKADEGLIQIRKNYTIGFLNQHIRFKKSTLLEEAALGLKESEKECLYKAEKILFGLGFKKQDLEKSIGEFSGGYQLRLHLAKVLISEPDCLLLDEPTNYLDIVSIRWFTSFLQQWQREFILVSHDREFMDNVTTHTLGIHREKIRKVKGSSVTFYEQILQEEEVYEKTRINLNKKRSQMQSFIDRFGAKATKAGQAQSRQKLLSRIPVLERLKELYNLSFSFHEAPFPGKKMMELDELFFAYDDIPLIRQLSISLEKGDRVAIVGKNGRGKSTLLRIMAKDLFSKSGGISHSDNLSIGYFGQTNIDRMNPQHTVEQEISLANHALNLNEVKSICGLMMFSGDQSLKKTHLLSGGEKSRVLLGKILAKPCNLLLLDEPTHHLDIESVEALIDALEEFEGCVVIVTHSELILKRIKFDKILVCHQGRQEVFAGDYEEFLEKDGWHDKLEKSEKKPKKEYAPSTETSESKIKKQLEREINKQETLIAQREKEKGELERELLTAVESNNLEKMQQLGLQIAQKQKNLEESYSQLEKLFEKY